MKKLLKISHQLKTGLKPYNNENGFIMAVVIILSLMLAITVTMAIWSASNEVKLVRHTGESTQSFYNAETALVAALAKPNDWLTGDFASAAPSSSWSIVSVDREGKLTVWKTSEHTSEYFTRTPAIQADEIALLHIRPISKSPNPITITFPDFDKRAEDIPRMAFGVPEDNGNSVIHTKTRFFSITSVAGGTGNNATEVIQIGVEQVTVNPSTGE